MSSRLMLDLRLYLAVALGSARNLWHCLVFLTQWPEMALLWKSGGIPGVSPVSYLTGISLWTFVVDAAAADLASAPVSASVRETSAQLWRNAGRASATLARHCTIVPAGSAGRNRWLTTVTPRPLHAASHNTRGTSHNNTPRCQHHLRGSPDPEFLWICHSRHTIRRYLFTNTLPGRVHQDKRWAAEVPPPQPGQTIPAMNEHSSFPPFLSHSTKCSARYKIGGDPSQLAAPTPGQRHVRGTGSPAATGATPGKHRFNRRTKQRKGEVASQLWRRGAWLKWPDRAGTRLAARVGFSRHFEDILSRSADLSRILDPGFWITSQEGGLKGQWLIPNFYDT